MSQRSSRKGSGTHYNTKAMPMNSYIITGPGWYLSCIAKLHMNWLACILQGQLGIGRLGKADLAI